MQGKRYGKGRRFRRTISPRRSVRERTPLDLPKHPGKLTGEALRNALGPDVLSLAQRFLSREVPPQSLSALVRAVDREMSLTQGVSRDAVIREMLKTLAAERQITLPKPVRPGARGKGKKK